MPKTKHLITKSDDAALVDLEVQFQSNFSDFSRILKFCYVALSALYDDIDNRENGSTRDIKVTTRSTKSTFSILIVHAIWRELLDFDELKDEKNKNILTAITKKPPWRDFCAPEERNKLIQHVKEVSRTKVIRNEFEIFVQRALQYIQDCLEEIGVIEIVFDSKNRDRVTKAKRKNLMNSIRYDTELCAKYGAALFDKSNTLPFFKDQNLFETLDSVIAKVCLRIHGTEEEPGQEHSSLQVYATKTLLYHLIKIGKIEDAVELLATYGFFRERVHVCGIKKASNLHGRDCTFLCKTLLAHGETDNVKNEVAPLFLKLKAFLEGTDGMENADIGNALYTNGLKLEKLGWMMEACDFFEASTKYLACVGDYHKEAAFALRKLGKYYVSVSMYNQGIKCYEREIKIEKHCFGRHHDRVAQTIELLAVTYMIRKDYERALSHFEELLHMKEIIFGCECFEVALVQKELGYLNYMLEKYQISLTHFSAAQIISKDYESKDRNFDTSLILWIGKVNSKLENYKTAIKYFDQTLSNEERFDGNTCQDIVAVLEAKGNAHFHVQEYDASIVCYKQASMISSDFQRRITSDDLRIICQLAHVLCLNQETEEALNLYRKALDYYKSGVYENNDNKCYVLKSLAEIYEKNIETEQAFECYVEIIDSNKDVLDESYSWIADKIKTLGFMGLRIGAINHATKYFLEAINVYGQTDANSKDVADLQSLVATLFVNGGEGKLNQEYALDTGRVPCGNEKLAEIINKYSSTEMLDTSKSCDTKKFFIKGSDLASKVA